MGPLSASAGGLNTRTGGRWLTSNSEVMLGPGRARVLPHQPLVSLLPPAPAPHPLQARRALPARTGSTSPPTMRWDRLCLVPSPCPRLSLLTAPQKPPEAHTYRGSPSSQEGVELLPPRSYHPLLLCSGLMSTSCLGKGPHQPHHGHLRFSNSGLFSPCPPPSCIPRCSDQKGMYPFPGPQLSES